MVIGYEQIVFGDQVLNLKSITKKKTPATIKQKIGGQLVFNQVPGRSTTDWEISGGDGIMFDTSTAATTARISLRALDDREKHHYSDGLITGSFIITNLTFTDNESNPLHFQYKISFIEYNQ